MGLSTVTSGHLTRKSSTNSTETTTAFFQLTNCATHHRISFAAQIPPPLTNSTKTGMGLSRVVSGHSTRKSSTNSTETTTAFFLLTNCPVRIEAETAIAGVSRDLSGSSQVARQVSLESLHRIVLELHVLPGAEFRSGRVWQFHSLSRVRRVVRYPEHLDIPLCSTNLR